MKERVGFRGLRHCGLTNLRTLFFHKVQYSKRVVVFHVLPFLIFPVLEIGAHTRYGKIFPAAVQKGNAVALPENEPPVFVQCGLHGKLVMLKS